MRGEHKMFLIVEVLHGHTQFSSFCLPNSLVKLCLAWGYGRKHFSKVLYSGIEPVTIAEAQRTTTIVEAH